MHLRKSEHSLRHIVFTITLVILFGLFGSLRAQDTTPTDPLVPTDASPTAAPTDAPTQEPPTAAPTDAPTVAPTQEPPTDVPTQEIPTDAPTLEQTAEASPTDTPSDIPPTLEVTPSPTLVVEAPVFSLADGTSYDAAPAGSPLIIQGSVADSMGMVMIMASATAGTVELTTAEPLETVAPFITQFTLSYTAAPDFSGQDTLTLLTANQAGLQTTITLTIKAALTATLTPTLEPTASTESMRELVIQYNPADSEEIIQAMLTSINAVEKGRIPQIGAMRILVPESVSQPDTAMAVLQSSNMAQLAGVAYAEENINYHLSVPDPLLPQQWGLSNTTGGVYASYAWSIVPKPGYGVTVAVVDSGVDLQHPDLIGQIATGGWDFFNDDNNPDDDLGHGTHVAGIIAAKINNGLGGAGLAYNARILPIKACDNLGWCPMYYVAEGIIYAVDMGARVINLSLGGDAASTLLGAVNYALSRGVVVVAAAGNTGCSDIACPNTLEYPAAYPGVISAAAHDSNGSIWDDTVNHAGSTFNDNVLVSAPGVGILSTWPSELDMSDGVPDGYTLATGTSMATAYVSATAAMLISSKVATTPATVRDALICGAEDDIPASGYDQHYGYGRLKSDFSLNWNGNSANCKVSLPNDDFQYATNITRVPFAVSQAVSSRSVTTRVSDPTTCGIAPKQTVWYQYLARTAGYYQFTTLGTSYNNVIGVYRGLEGALTSIGCTTNMQLAVPLDAGQTYYIVVGTNAVNPVEDQVLQFRLNPVIPFSNRDYQENSTSIAYIGTWMRGAVPGASGSYTQQTSDAEAFAAFSFRGTHFDYARTIGPDKGAVKVYINGAYVTTISNRAAIQKANQVAPSISVPGNVIGSWNTVYLQRDNTVPGSVDLDRIRTYDFDNTALATIIASKVDDRNAALRYITVNSSDDWVKIPYTGAFYNTLSETGVENAGIAFRFRGNALTLFRMTGPGFADMQVTIDNSLTQTISNIGPSPAILPYTIDNLTITDHVVELRKLGAGGTIQIDAVQALTLATLKAPTSYDERVASIAYRGTWTDTAAVVGAKAYTTRSLNDGSEASFQFQGNNLCIGYQKPNGLLDVYLDGSGTPIKTIPEDAAGSGFTMWCMETDLHTLLADTLHYARLVAHAGTVPETKTFTLDYINPLRYNILTPARRQVQESDTAFFYSSAADWTTLSTLGKSAGGFKPQGGYLRETSTDNTMITFYINGTGFILYTAIGNNRGCWDVAVDANPIELINLAPDNARYSPLGYGITGLPSGIHRIQLTANTDCSTAVFPGYPSDYPVDFDAVRVFP